MTRKMNLKYIRPVLVGTPLTIKGQLIESKEPSNKIMAKAEIRDDQGNLLARSSGEFVAIAKEEMPSDFDGSKKEIFSMIEKLPPL